MKISAMLGWFFGLLVLTNGILNLFRGNDQLLGVAFVFASFIYFPPSFVYIQKKLGFPIHYGYKIALGILILWITGAVGAIAEGYVF